MKVLLALIFAAASGYFLGSLNSSIISVRLLKGKDIRTMGSHNAGLTNTLRCAGSTCAAITLAGDLLKGIIAVTMSRGFCNLINAGIGSGNDTHYIGYIAGFFAIIGHIYPIYYGFKGGKGVLVAASTFLAVNPKVFIACITIFIVVLALSKYVSLASIISCSYVPLATLLMSLIVEQNSFGRSFLYMMLTLPMMGMVIWMHRTNIVRLKNGTENKFKFKSKDVHEET
ncbi:MAG: glycerol-3-phosphate 1-O-acyltransferase PlsY [Ruminococcus sp.]|nr:glycerol-3-phosphate 1-O-acyltransferase PlsY [Ruminococcus sp.]